jgi:hypothetical protein
LNKTELRVQKTIAYLESEIGKENWLLNVGYGFDDEKNLFAAVQIATHLIKYENIIEVLEIVRRAMRVKALGNIVPCMTGH